MIDRWVLGTSLNDRDYDIGNCVMLMTLPNRVVREHDQGFDQTMYVCFPMRDKMVILHPLEFVTRLFRQYWVVGITGYKL